MIKKNNVHLRPEKIQITLNNYQDGLNESC